MPDILPKPETTLAVILGASEFPKQSQLTASKAFLKSAMDLKNYLLSAKGLALPAENVLDLFDSNLASSAIDEELASFLDRRQSDIKTQQLTARDLIVYYVGHGGFSRPGDEYFLALRGTRAGNESMTSYAITALANTLREHASFLRRFLILDSCFSAAAQASFQSAPLEVAKQQTLAEFPDKGTALLCASGPKDPAKSLPDQVYTMFSGAFLDILQKGSLDKPERLSLFDVGQLTTSLIKERFPDKAVRPELHSPDQKQGDVVVLPLFPNPAKRRDDVLERLADEMSALRERQEKVEKLYETLEKFVHEPEAQAATSLPTPMATSEIIPATYRYGLTRIEWQSLPVNLKTDITAWVASNRAGMAWLGLCVAVCATTIFAQFTSSVLGRVNSLLVCGIVMILSLVAQWLTTKGFVRFLDPEKWRGPWEDLDILTKMRVQKGWVWFFGWVIAVRYFAVCTVLYSITFFIGLLLYKMRGL